ncbi:LacI family DNA-binding transcriptional regulator [Spirillospora sp. NPDC029432]|uniref:LacI family DNA-binding transcriptional regulator n=1 Tax=Spirillospora sp. NPDC029432 TaxID=3154599 RepID=UPI00345149F9
MTKATRQQRVTAADVAGAAGVSRATVGFVLNDTPGQTISEGTRRRVLEAAVRLGYRPHTAAQALASGRSRLILLVLPDWPIEYSMRRCLDEASLALDRRGYSLVTYTPHAGGRARPLWESLSPDVVVGFTSFGAEDLASMRACGVTKVIPAAGQGSPFWRPPVAGAGSALQVEHLHERGHRRLAFGASDDARLGSLVQERFGAAQACAGELGLPELDVRRIGRDDGSAAAAVRHWHEAGVSGVVAYNDDIAAVVTGAAVRAGLSVPGDLAVIGHDDSPLAGMFVPSLSSVRVDTADLGRYLAELALQEAEGSASSPAQLAVEAEVVPRESTRSRHDG